MAATTTGTAASETAATISRLTLARRSASDRRASVDLGCRTAARRRLARLGDVGGRARQRVERHPPVAHVVLAEEDAAGVFTQPTCGGVAVVGVEHDSATTGFDLEDTRDDARQQEGAETLVDDRQLGDGGVQAYVVGIGVIPRRDGILCGAVNLDVSAVLAVHAADERAGVVARPLRA